MGNQFSVLFNDHLMRIGLAIDFNSIEIKACTQMAGINGKLMCTAGNKTVIDCHHFLTRDIGDFNYNVCSPVEVSIEGSCSANRVREILANKDFL
jgi:hypothetical protein